MAEYVIIKGGNAGRQKEQCGREVQRDRGGDSEVHRQAVSDPVLPLPQPVVLRGDENRPVGVPSAPHCLR